MKRYPFINNFLIYKKRHDGMILAKDILTEEYTMGRQIARFSRQLRGQDPFLLVDQYPSADIQEMLNSLESFGLLRHTRVWEKRKGNISCTLWIPRSYISHSFAPKILNYLLLTLFFPILTLGIWKFSNHIWDVLLDYDTFTYLSGLLYGLAVGFFLHEAGHYTAARCYGAYVFEAGVGVTHYMPCFYVMIDDTNVKRMLPKVQIHLAGIEMNLLIAGVVLLLASTTESAGVFFFGAAISNFITCLMNCLGYFGLDGMNVICELLGAKSASFTVREIVRNKELRQRLRRKGITGAAELAVCYILVGMQLLIPICFTVGIWSTILWFL